MVTSTAGLVVVLIAAILLIVLLIGALKMHGSLALTIAAIAVALVTGVSLGDVGQILEEGVGGTLGFLVLIIGFGAVLGKLLEVSGGAERLATSMLNVFGEKRAPIVMSLLGLLAGIPVFVEVGFVLLVPLVFVVARKAGMSRLRIGVPLIVSLMCVHCLLPPHPAATAISNTLGADIGQVIMLGLLVAIPTSLIGGPFFMRFADMRLAQEHASSTDAKSVKQGVNKRVGGGDGSVAYAAVIATETDESASDAAVQQKELPGFGITVFTILLPLLLMVAKTISEGVFAEGQTARLIFELIGHPIIALLISVIFAYWSLGLHRGMRLEKLSSITDSSFAPIGGVLLIIGAGGAFNAVLMKSGVAPALADALGGLPVSPIVIAWLIALVLHFAVGSATVAMISAAGIVLPMLAANPDLNPAILVLAVGAGAMGLTHVTDSLFWLYKEYMGIEVGTALKTLTVGTTIASVVALACVMVLHIFV
ncbi:MULTISPECIES: SLC13 family permease [Propionimicrobium]|uniref:Gluconate:H+ symporter (GntP) family transporter n=1 Tax=Propionimicrobium lymphophilum ACS-093-V-SCH5 TaxID=883161 RepID=S2W003_9ACTN|nr:MULTISPECIES: SLC13 family permease [Propionimicrobium]EPD33098.1 hypothetical protein HMPREF9306_00627 [Propionimicrobium lymphophilum ACS-093-V-SCH5]ETJ98519.1 putative DsdX permease [Propionimicrobium sp. BV2F7]